MTKKEFAMFSMALKTYYPKENLLPNEQAIELWFYQLQDIPYKIAEAGLNKWVATNKWSPSIAEIREMASDVMHGELPDWADAWQEVCVAISRYGYYRADEAIESLSPLTRKATRCMGFVNLCLSDNQTADRANFRVIYNGLLEKEKKDALLPPKLKELIAEVQSKMLDVKEAE